MVCIGGATVDRTYQARAPLVPGTSNPVTGDSGFGGVARNVAENLVRLGVPVHLISAIGSDAEGLALLSDLKRLGIGFDHVRTVEQARTAVYGALIEPTGELFAGFADMDVLDAIDTGLLDAALPKLTIASIVFADCNLSAETLDALVRRLSGTGARLAVDAVSVAKSARLPADLRGIDILFLNRDEARAVLSTNEADPGTLAEQLRARGAGAAVVTCGRDGAALATADGPVHIAAQVRKVVNVTGAGDALIAGALARLFEGAKIEDAVRAGVWLAGRTVGTAHSVCPDLEPGLLTEQGKRD